MATELKNGRVELDVIQPLFQPGNISTVHRVVLEEKELYTFGVIRRNRHIFMLVAKPEEGIVKGIVDPQSNPVIRIAQVPSDELAYIHSRMRVSARRFFGRKEAKSALLDLLRVSEARFRELEAKEPDIFHPNIAMSRDIERMANDVKSGFLRGAKA